VERKRKQDEERFHKELEKDLTLRILYRDSNDMPYIGCQVNLLGCNYYRMLVDFSNGVLKNVIQKMQASNIPPNVWALMQDLGVDDVGLHVAMHNIQYGLNVDRSNWKITSDTLRLLELTYARGRAIGNQSLERQLAYEACRQGDCEEVANHATPDQKLRMAEALPLLPDAFINQEKHYVSRR
jgi:hypothetical protein